MTISVEYLAIFRRTDSFCDSVESFTRLLQVNSKIKVTSGNIHYEGGLACRFQISNGEIAAKSQRYFHLYLAWDGDPSVANESLERRSG